MVLTQQNWYFGLLLIFEEVKRNDSLHRNFSAISDFQIPSSVVPVSVYVRVVLHMYCEF